MLRCVVGVVLAAQLADVLSTRDDNLQATGSELETTANEHIVSVCYGENRGDFKCNQKGDPTHHVCAQLLDNTNKQPLTWGSGNFWDITGQSPWVDQLTGEPNGGTSWCICMWATASLIESAGCDNVHIDCSATDLDFVCKRYIDGGVKLDKARTCLFEKCGDEAKRCSEDAQVKRQEQTKEEQRRIERRGRRQKRILKRMENPMANLRPNHLKE